MKRSISYTLAPTLLLLCIVGSFGQAARNRECPRVITECDDVLLNATACTAPCENPEELCCPTTCGERCVKGERVSSPEDLAHWLPAGSLAEEDPAEEDPAEEDPAAAPPAVLFAADASRPAGGSEASSNSEEKKQRKKIHDKFGDLVAERKQRKQKKQKKKDAKPKEPYSKHKHGHVQVHDAAAE